MAESDEGLTGEEYGAIAADPEAADAPEDNNLFSHFGIVVLGLYHLALATALGVGLFLFWQTIPDGDNLQPTELQLFILVTMTGALGSYIHAATSFASYAGNQQLAKSWLWWYLLRPFIGAALALIVYFLLRAGMLSPGSSPEALNLYGIAAVAGLSGMFSKQATDKLRELFDNLFRTASADDRANKLSDSVTEGQR